MQTIILPAVHSTNTYVSQNAGALPIPCVVRAVEQTAGRGQRGNTWEAEPGLNLTLSFHLRPEGILPREQFAVSEAIALAVCDTLAHYNIPARIKWPNDVYVDDRKICGILIEHSLYGMEIRHTIAGIGLNVNQNRFVSDAPNPVSMTQLTGRSYDLDEVADILGGAVERRMKSVALSAPAGHCDTPCRAEMHREFMRTLWRGEGEWPFRDTANGELFRASIADVSPEGFLTLHPSDGTPPRRYAFKEVAFLLQ